MDLELSHASLHHFILAEIVEKGRAPRLKEISLRFQVGDNEAEEALEALQEYHGVVLQPKTC